MPPSAKPPICRNARLDRQSQNRPVFSPRIVNMADTSISHASCGITSEPTSPKSEQAMPRCSPNGHCDSAEGLVSCEFVLASDLRNSSKQGSYFLKGAHLLQTTV